MRKGGISGCKKTIELRNVFLTTAIYLEHSRLVAKLQILESASRPYPPVRLVNVNKAPENGKSVTAQSLEAIAADFRVQLPGNLPGSVEEYENILGQLPSC